MITCNQHRKKVYTDFTKFDRKHRDIFPIIIWLIHFEWMYDLTMVKENSNAIQNLTALQIWQFPFCFLQSILEEAQ